MLASERQAKAAAADQIRREVEEAGITVAGLIELIDICERLPAAPIQAKLAELDGDSRNLRIFDTADPAMLMVLEKGADGRSEYAIERDAGLVADLALVDAGDGVVIAGEQDHGGRCARGDGAAQCRGRTTQYLAAHPGECAGAAPVVPRDRARGERPGRGRPGRRRPAQTHGPSLALAGDGPYLERIAEIARAAEVSPIEFAERQQFLLTNPGLGGRLQVTSTMRCAVSIYNPGDVAPVHIHTPNASRTILSENGGYTTIEGERCKAARGDLILTPNGTWHDHGNDGADPVIWIDVLDFPLMEFLDCVWLDEEFPGATEGNARAQAATDDGGYSHRLYGQGGLVPGFVSHRRGFGRATSPMFHYRGDEVRAALDGLRDETGDPYEGVTLRVCEPGDRGIGVSDPRLPRDAAAPRRGNPVQARDRRHPLPGHRRQRLDRDRRRQARLADRTISSWCRASAWRRHVNRSAADAVLYAVSDMPLLEKIGQYRAQGRLPDDTVAELVS